MLLKKITLGPSQVHRPTEKRSLNWIFIEHFPSPPPYLTTTPTGLLYNNHGLEQRGL